VEEEKQDSKENSLIEQMKNPLKTINHQELINLEIYTAESEVDKSFDAEGGLEPTSGQHIF
jgi:peptidoglycan/LPS O-acetylase OafA/YrhL